MNAPFGIDQIPERDSSAEVLSISFPLLEDNLPIESMFWSLSRAQYVVELLIWVENPNALEADLPLAEKLTQPRYSSRLPAPCGVLYLQYGSVWEMVVDLFDFYFTNKDSIKEIIDWSKGALEHLRPDLISPQDIPIRAAQKEIVSRKRWLPEKEDQETVSVEDSPALKKLKEQRLIEEEEKKIAEAQAGREAAERERAEHRLGKDRANRQNEEEKISHEITRERLERGRERLEGERERLEGERERLEWEQEHLEGEQEQENQKRLPRLGTEPTTNSRSLRVIRAELELIKLEFEAMDKNGNAMKRNVEEDTLSN